MRASLADGDVNLDRFPEFAAAFDGRCPTRLFLEIGYPTLQGTVACVAGVIRGILEKSKALVDLGAHPIGFVQ
jgi:hypothetical protein